MDTAEPNGSTTDVRDLELSVRRSVVPVIAGVLLAHAARLGLSIPEDALVGVLEGLVISTYYVVLRLAERHVPALGWLLGALAIPTYPDERRTHDTEEDDADG